MKKILLLLCALMFAAPVFAADPAPVATGATQAEPAAKPAKEAPKKAKKAKKKKSAKASADSKTPLACSVQTCGGVQGCYQPKCGAACGSC